MFRTKDVRWLIRSFQGMGSGNGFVGRYFEREGTSSPKRDCYRRYRKRGVKGGLAVSVYQKISIDEMRNQARSPLLIIQTCLLDQQEAGQLNRGACRYRSTIQYNRVV